MYLLISILIHICKKIKYTNIQKQQFRTNKTKKNKIFYKTLKKLFKNTLIKNSKCFNLKKSLLNQILFVVF